MIDAYALELDPPAIIEPARSRGRDRSRSRDRRDTAPTSRRWRGYVVGAVLVLANGDECRLLIDHRGRRICRDERGRVWMLPE